MKIHEVKVLIAGKMVRLVGLAGGKVAATFEGLPVKETKKVLGGTKKTYDALVLDCEDGEPSRLSAIRLVEMIAMKPVGKVMSNSDVYDVRCLLEQVAL